MIVIDASVLANAVGDDAAAGRRARALLRQHRDLAAPDLVNVETAAVLRRRWLAGTITPGRFEQAVDDLSDMPVARFPTLGLLHRVFELRANFSAYDACYVALAEALDCPLCTGDGRLARASVPRCTIELITVEADSG